MPREKVAIPDANGAKVEYDGLLLRDILKRVGAPLEGQLRGAALASYLVADRRDGKPLRSVRRLETLEVVMLKK
jgi:hypothetical protein